MTRYNREDPRTVLPQLEKQVSDVSEKLSPVVKKVAPIGESIFIEGSGSMPDVSIEASTYVDIGDVYLDAGVWVVTCRARFIPNASGNHYSTLCFSETSGSGMWHDRVYGGTTYNNQHNMTKIVAVSKRTHFYLTGGTNAKGAWRRDSAGAFAIEAVRIV